MTPEQREISPEMAQVVSVILKKLFHPGQYVSAKEIWDQTKGALDLEAEDTCLRHYQALVYLTFMKVYPGWANGVEEERTPKMPEKHEILPGQEIKRQIPVPPDLPGSTANKESA